jgi:hypothetical protein
MRGWVGGRSGLAGPNERDVVKFLFALLFILMAFSACGRLHKHDIEASLVSEMERNCRQVEIKRDYDHGVYVITYTGKISKGRCPVALIRGWEEGRTIENKEVEICGCRDR